VAVKQKRLQNYQS